MLSSIILFAACTSKSSRNFKSERLSRTATFNVNGNIETVFPLFGAFEERKLDHSWKPELIYPDSEIISKGTTFRTYVQHEHSSSEKEFIWHVINYQPDRHLIEYLVSTSNRIWNVEVFCVPVSNQQTNIIVTYTYIGLNELGNELNKKAIEDMFKNNLKDWEEGINHYLKTGHAINEPNQ